METSDTSLPAKADAESLPLGGLRLSIVAGSEEWLHEERQTRLLKKVVGLRDELIHSKRAVACATTRLIVFTSDIAEEISRWQLELGYPVLNSSDDLAVAVGRTFTWGDGEPETTYSVIVLAEFLAEHLIGDDVELQMQATGVLAHELAHAHDNFRRIHQNGDSQTATNIGRDGVRYGIAESMWAETFAESVASIYYPSRTFDSQIALAMEMAKACRSHIRSAILRVQAGRDRGEFLGEVTSELSKTANQVSRVIGLLMARGNETQVDELRSRLRTISDRWLLFFDHACELLRNQLESELRRYEALYPLIDELFQANGLVLGDRGIEFVQN